MIHLTKGDVIGIVAPSAPISAFCPRRTTRGIDALRRLGFKIKLGDTVKKVTDFTAGTAKERIDDIHRMFQDKEVKAIIATIGGYNANDLMDSLDYELIAKNNDKIFMGYSDITVLLLTLAERSKVPTIMGPMLLPQFGEYPEVFDFTKESFLFVSSNLGSGKEYILPVAKETTEEKLWWDKQDNRPRKMTKNNGWTVIRPGEAKGPLIAGNLNTLLKLAGTKYFPNSADAILFLEDDEDENAASVQRMLQQLRQMGVMSRIKGMVFGRFQKKSGISNQTLKEIISNVLGKEEKPVIANVDFGHTDPTLSLPLGKQVSVATLKKEIRVVL